MSWLDLNFGTGVNTGTGDDLRTAFSKVDNNLKLLRDNSLTKIENVGAGELLVHPSTSSNQIQIKSLEGQNGIKVTSDDTVVIISTEYTPLKEIKDDKHPILGGTLNLNNFPIQSIDSDTNLFDNIMLNNLTIEEGSNGTILSTPFNIVLKSSSSTSVISFESDVVTSKNISCGKLTANTFGLHIGNVTGNINGDLVGNTTGIHTGDVIGKVSGTAGDISNHSIANLSDVSKNIPSKYSILAYNETEYEPTSINDLVKNQIVPFKLPQFTTVARNALIPENGDIIYNVTEHKFQGYEGGTWVNLI